jgi:DHA1 family tetracycline resistance protein-like MFS transporter
MSALLLSLGVKGNIKIMAVQTIIGMIGFGAIFAVWQPYVLSTGLTVVHIGLIQSVLNLSTAAGLFTWGTLSDRIGRKPVIIISHISRALCAAALIISPSLTWLLSFAFFAGLSALFQQGNPARSALITESVSKEKRASAYSVLMASSQITGMVTASAGGYVALVYGYQPIFWVAFLGEALGALSLARWLKETRKPEAVERKPLKQVISETLVPEKKVKDLYAILILIGLGYGTGYSIFYGTLVADYGLTPFQIGLLSTVFNLSWGLSSIPLGKVADRVGRKPMLLGSWFFSMTTVMGFLLFRSFPAFLFFNITSGLDGSFWVPSWVSLVSERVEEKERSRILGKLDAYNRLVGIPAPYLAGLLYTNYGFAAPLIVLLCCGIVWGVFILRLIDSNIPDTPTARISVH